MHIDEQHEQHEQIRAYIHGRMTADEVLAFEQAFFADDALLAELERAIEIQAATAEAAARPARYAVPSWFGIAATAVLAMLALAYYQFVPRSDVGDSQVMRGEASELQVTITQHGSALAVSWTAVAGASQYQVNLYRSDGIALSEQRTSETALRVNLESGADYLRVTALGELGNVLTDSGLLALDAAE